MESQEILRKNLVLPIEKFQSLVQPIMLQHPYYLIFTPLTVKRSFFGMKKAEENFKILALKVVIVAYERCWLTRGSQYRGKVC